MALLRQPLRRLTCALALGLAGCGGGGTYEDDLATGLRWLEDEALRRQVLESALVDPDNGYARLRLERYRPERWGALDAWWPRVAPAVAGAGAPAAFEPAVGAPDVLDEATLTALGEAAFTRYPLQLEARLAAALAADPAACGFEVGPDGVVEGVVWVELPDGPQPGLTCAACHGGGPGLGRANPALDLAAALTGTCGVPSGWGPGRVDVTADGVENPTAIPDLRPVRMQAFLHRAGSLRNDRLVLAMRTETLILTSLGASVRPPPVVALGLSWWMWGLADGLPPTPEDGAEVFTARCGGCHDGPGGAGQLAPLSAGTDMAVLTSPERGTGRARVPALAGLGDRAPLFSGGAARDLDGWWADPDAVPGHPSPAALPEAERAALLRHLSLR
ncbi:MAG: c-type cytochrome [Deltaproteobacteria bacterium]|nr:c-type cytochrome [Deltaproteobacteria bacterium]